MIIKLDRLLSYNNLARILYKSNIRARSLVAYFIITEKHKLKNEKIKEFLLCQN